MPETLEINWLTPTKIRELYVRGERGMFRADYLTQDLYFYENTDASGDQWAPISVLGGVSEGAMTRFAIRKKEPLHAGLEAFLAAVQGDSSRMVNGHDGLKALELALAIVTSGAEHRAVTLNSGAG